MNRPSDDSTARALPQHLLDAPFVVNGTEGGDQEDWLRALPVTHQPAARAELGFAAAVRRGLIEKASEARGDAGLARLNELLSIQTQQAQMMSTRPPTSSRTASKASWWVRLQRHLQPPLLVVGAVAAVQAAVILQMVADPPPASETAVMRASPGAVGQPVPHLRVVFRDDVLEAQMRQLLTREGLVIVAGPTLLGEYRLVRDGAGPWDRERTLERLRADAAVASADADDGPVRSGH